ncbi:MAG: hypothetical protein LBH59_07690 [Planctomycetaceae bacterium]|nr:hypothetical protein [Planctomycetaceae bacterium]
MFKGEAYRPYWLRYKEFLETFLIANYLVLSSFLEILNIYILSCNKFVLC